MKRQIDGVAAAQNNQEEDGSNKKYRYTEALASVAKELYQKVTSTSSSVAVPNQDQAMEPQEPPPVPPLQAPLVDMNAIPPPIPPPQSEVAPGPKMPKANPPQKDAELCQKGDCLEKRQKNSKRCAQHKGVCLFEDCTTHDAGGGFCKRHGGGKRCRFEGCNTGAEGPTDYCKKHGGGRRCGHDGCIKSAQGGTLYCKAHGGGLRCKYEGCDKASAGNDLCKAHGGGRRCNVAGCGRSAQGATYRCKAHGGGRRCHKEGCSKLAKSHSDYCANHTKY